MSVHRLACMGLILLFGAACNSGEPLAPSPTPTTAVAPSPTGTPLPTEANRASTLVPTAVTPPATAVRPTSNMPPTAPPATTTTVPIPGNFMTTPVLANPPPSSQPSESPPASPATIWEVETLLVAPGEPGRLYALMKDSSGPLWGSPASHVRLMVSDDYAVTWAPFAGGLPVNAACMINVNLDYATSDALYASTCQGLYAWDPSEKIWGKRSDHLTDVVAVAYGQPNSVWAAAHGDRVIRSTDGGRTWQDASTGLTTFGGMANLGFDARDNGTLYGIIRPKYAGNYLRRGTSDGRWQTMPTPLDNATIDTGMTVDGATGALYVMTQIPPVSLWRASNPDTADMADVIWELVHDFGPDMQVSLLASGWAPQGLAIYANIWPLTPLAGGGATVGGATASNPALHRSPDGGQTWEPLATP
jgi:hypothetical protein